MSSDPEWKYINVRRFVVFLESSIGKGTEWAGFEENGEPLWTRVRSSINDFLLRFWRSGALMGNKPEQAFFVRLDRTTMTQDDIDNGRLIGIVGVAPLRPAEFVIFRIGQKTASGDP
jgi:phage tail sheath protein FI